MGMERVAVCSTVVVVVDVEWFYCGREDLSFGSVESINKELFSLGNGEHNEKFIMCGG